MDLVINYFAVLVAAVLSFVVGWVWHSPILFLKPWMESIGMKVEGPMPSLSSMLPTMLVALIAQIVLAGVFAHNIAAYQLANVTGSTGIAGLVGAAGWTWLGFMAVKHLDLVLWEKRSLQWFAIEAGASLVQLVVMAAVLVYWPA